ncbi:non-homologous end-joining DNA ligase [Microbacterium sp. EYE_5]|uniref:non-homologous end-joining DNA ligase n=1 Tax=unclassified Microbacterium TaxID=2609290 RepID=UPI002003EB74|nr:MULTISPECIES: non-homologous end-joining DNA ligase [unclassified Microbacterium]MCK6081699.1 non-homologous end-joining DNA ligase [Microbacterium sp. EYE_382]MCK6086969.1 non-homologous end-joining DNA ligase [Microbacterium sp. EYE_384]MCK6123533.1 non-homologous end-joining DNA ligase [Microbacterium sp. EYE_80]MCK6126442.1 non-homologous end-joining DNA ligase [Microbacterium sp. EYE_79]MCK6142653.1 non-homologous end-joining DNA ligase [Microbacterium sp. EYE_39]
MASERITLQIPGGREISLSNPNRLVYPEAGVTKHELAEYVIAVGDPFLRANGHRPVSLERFPDAVGGESFFSKNPPKGTPDYVDQVMCTYNSGRRHPQVVIGEIAAAVWAVQMNTVVFHPWASLAADTDNPVELRIDLDPQPGTDFADAAAVAPALREVLREAGLEAWLKTSGNRGIHVFCPIEPTHEFLDVRHAVIAAGRELERRLPDKVTTNWWKEERGERIFIDYNQANRDRTMAGAYSPRALPSATVATPITWDELEAGVDPASFTVRTVPERLAQIGDPWEGLQDAPGRIDTLLDWWQRDLDDGLGELAFPPEFPKMPGEPPRVQPSRAKKV